MSSSMPTPLSLSRKRWSSLLTIAMLVVASAAAQDMYSGVTTYSDTSADDYGNISGWGVTSACTQYATHYSDVDTTLTSPNGRQSHTSYSDAGCSIRADVYLPFDPNDLGYYDVNSTHRAHCPFYTSQWYFLNTSSSALIRLGSSRTVYIFDTTTGGRCYYHRDSPCNVRCPGGYYADSPGIACGNFAILQLPWVQTFVGGQTYWFCVSGFGQITSGIVQYPGGCGEYYGTYYP